MLSQVVNLVRWNRTMLTAIDKGMKAAEVGQPPAGVYGDVDLRVLPRFISFKAASLRQKANLQYIIIVIAFGWISTFIIQNNRIDYWQSKYREKEFILVPSKIIGHTPSVPQSVPQSYVQSAIKSFIQMAGTTTPMGIRDQLRRLGSYMEPRLGSKFLAEMDEWIELCEKKGIYEQVEDTKIEFLYNQSGVFKVKAIIRRDRRENAEFLGTAMEEVLMTLIVQQPKPDQEWTFQISEFSRKPL